MASSLTAFEKSKIWCERNPTWRRICDIEDSDRMILKWHEIPERVRKLWKRHYGVTAEDAWHEFGDKPCRHRYGLIAEDGKFYDEFRKMPRLMNSMLVYEIGGEPGIYYRGGMKARSHKAGMRLNAH